MLHHPFKTFTASLALIVVSSFTLLAQQSVDVYPDSSNFYSVNCPAPVTGTMNISGTATNFNSATDSIGVRINWGDGTFDFDSVALNEAGTTDYFYTSFVHTYNLAGTYAQQLIATAGNGIADTSIVDTFIVHNNCVLIDGYVYNDLNSNCSKEASDDSVSGAKVSFYHSGSLLGTASTNQSGYYQQSLPLNLTGVIVKVSTNGNSWSATCPTSGQHTFNSTSSQSFNFGLECDGSTDFRAHHSVSGIEAPGQCTGQLSFVATAVSCTSESATAVLTLDPDISFHAMINGPAPDLISGNVLTWNFNVQASYNGWTNGINPQFYVCTDTDAVVFDTACFHVEVTADSVNPYNNEDTWCLKIDGPWDPNDKAVSSPGMELNGNTAPDSKLTYRVRFQNTGTAPAMNVYILDSISNKLNLETFEVLATSRPMTFKTVDERVIRFDFKNIQLPDSNTNEPESHGYIIYSIEMKESLPVGTQIHNTAHIFFDYNEPIVTNTTTNTVYIAPDLPDPLKIQVGIGDVTCLNSDNGFLDLTVVSGNPPYSYAWSNGETSEDQSDLPSGSYTVTVTDDSLLTATATAEIIEDRQHADPVVGTITGPLSVQSWKPYTYVVATPGQSEFEWNISGGEVLSTTSNTAEVLWHAGPDGMLYIQEKDQYGCYGNDSVEVPILFVGIKEPTSYAFSMHPNPTDGVLAIELNTLIGSESVEVHDLRGSLITQKRIARGTTYLDLRDVPTGVYTVSVMNEEGAEHQRLVVH